MYNQLYKQSLYRLNLAETRYVYTDITNIIHSTVASF